MRNLIEGPWTTTR